MRKSHDGRDTPRPPAMSPLAAMSARQHGDPRHLELPEPAGLRVRTFSNYPDLAAWCRPHIPDAAQRHFAMGHGGAFVALVSFLRREPGADIILLAFTEAATDGRAECLKSVIACLRRDAVAVAQMPADAVVLYQRGD